MALLWIAETFSKLQDQSFSDLTLRLWDKQCPWSQTVTDSSWSRWRRVLKTSRRWCFSPLPGSTRRLGSSGSFADSQIPSEPSTSGMPSELSGRRSKFQPSQEWPGEATPLMPECDARNYGKHLQQMMIAFGWHTLYFTPLISKHLIRLLFKTMPNANTVQLVTRLV